MARNTVLCGLGVYLVFYLLFWYKKTRNWLHLLLAIVILSLLPFSVMRVLNIPVTPFILSLGWWRYVLLGLEIAGLIIAGVKFVSDSVQERP